MRDGASAMSTALHMTDGVGGVVKLRSGDSCFKVKVTVRDWQGFTNPWGYCSRVVRVGVRVWIPQPFTYPYPLRRVLIPLKGKRRVQESRMY